MRLLLPEDLLVLVGVGAVVVGVVLLVVQVARQRRHFVDALARATADRAGEAATGPSALPAAVGGAVDSVDRPIAPEQPAAAPPVASPPPAPPVVPDQWTAATNTEIGAHDVSPSGGSASAGSPANSATATDPIGRCPDAVPASEPTAAPAPEPAGPPTPPDVPPAPVTDVGVAAEPGHDRPAPDNPPRAAAQRAPDSAGSSAGSARTVADAVAQAFAVRAAAQRTSARGPASASDEGPPESAPPARPLPATGSATSEPEGPALVSGPPLRPEEAKDRLLAVLLEDPARVLGATVDLDACRARPEWRSDAASRAGLRRVLEQLLGAGLRPDQLARLAGMPLDDVQEVLAPESSDSAEG